MATSATSYCPSLKWQALLAVADSVSASLPHGAPHTEWPRHAQRPPSPLPPLRHASMKRRRGARALPAVLPTVDEHFPFCCPSDASTQQPDTPASSSCTGLLPLSSGSPIPSVELPATPYAVPGSRAAVPLLLLPQTADAAAAAGKFGSSGNASHPALSGEPLGEVLQGELGGVLLCLLRRKAARRLLVALRVRALRLAVLAEAAREQALARGSKLLH
ncbi:hypothetical protein ABPG75_009992 [Micractinium tetrahymenae]